MRVRSIRRFAETVLLIPCTSKVAPALILKIFSCKWRLV